MKVAVFYDFLEAIGGAERVALTLARHLDADLITTTVSPAFLERAGIQGVRVVSLGPTWRGTPVRHIHASAKFARARFPGYDLYVFSGNWAHFAAKRHHPNVYYCHTPTRMFYDQREATLARLSLPGRAAARLWFAAHTPLDRRAVRHCDRIVASSQNGCGRIRRYYDRDADVVYPPVDTRRFRFRELGEYWLSVTRMYPEKRVDLQLDVFRRLPNEKLVVVGGYAKGDRTEAYVRSLRPPPNVALVGEVDQERLVDLYGRCRGLIATAVDEDIGLTPIEAMASGKAVVAVDEGGYRETVLDGRTGFLLPADPGALAARIRSLDEDALRSMRAACEARAQEFDESVFFAKMDAILAEAR